MLNNYRVLYSNKTKPKYSLLTCIVLFLLNCTFCYSQTDPSQPNILLIIADDLGVDVTNGYQNNPRMPNTPVLDSLRSAGLTFKNAWAYPTCTPTRSAIMSGKYGVKTGVLDAPGNLDVAHTSLFKELATVSGNAYSEAVIGKWHVSNPADYTHPVQHGVNHYEGVFNSSVSDYYDWTKVTNGTSSNELEYTTTNLTNAAIDWVNAQNQPWFLWLAHVAPHTPFHIPPDSTYTSGQTNSNLQKYMTMIESLDFEIGRLIKNIPTNVLNNTTIIFLGDNGTPTGVIQNFPSDHSKGTLYQGGIHVPFIVSGAGVTRQNQEEEALVHATDIYATVLDIAGANLPGGIYNSMSFEPLLSNSAGPSRPYNYCEISSGTLTGWTIRNDQYKLIEFADGTQEFYDLIADTLEQNNMIGSLTSIQESIKTDLEAEAFDIRTNWSCQDLIQNGVEDAIDQNCDTSYVCVYDNTLSTTNIGCCASPSIDNFYNETVENGIRNICTNNLPNHDFCYKNNNSIPYPKNYVFEMDASPAIATSTTSILASNNRPKTYFGVALNGVLIAPAPATPFIFENPTTGEFNWNWVFEATNNQGSGSDLVALDCASAHTGPQGYHYHGNMFEYVEHLQTGISTTSVAPAQPLQVGWAADGFPILYRFGPDASGNITELQSSFRLKSGDRPGDGLNAPCGPYNGKYTNDYEFVQGIGDLDECNGVQRSITLNTSQGTETFDYFYVVTETFPQIGRCFSGTPNLTFDGDNKGSAFISLKVFLEGAYLNGTEQMRTDLVDKSLIPYNQPYGQAPFNYNGSETITNFPSNMVDWVLVEQRSSLDPCSVISTKAGVLLSDGYIKSVDGLKDLAFELANNASYYFVIRHRNHLDIMTKIAIGDEGFVNYDFTTNADMAYGSLQQKTAMDGKAFMITGDMNIDQTIQTTDFDKWIESTAIINTYSFSDVNLDGIIQTTDFDFWNLNNAKLSPAELQFCP